MTGRRRRRGRGLSAERREQMSWETYRRAWELAPNPRRRHSTTSGYLRAVMKRADPRLEAELAEEADRFLLELAERGRQANIAAARENQHDHHPRADRYRQ